MEADARLEEEAGGHRVQRIPRNERKGRVHTSTVTVSVIRKSPGVSGEEFREDDVKLVFFSGTGAGGQHRNKKMNSVRATHVPTGVSVTRQSRNRDDNVREAMAEIKQRLAEVAARNSSERTNTVRRVQIGSGMRGDKVRTYRFRDDVVEDHRTGLRISCRDFMRGGVRQLWKGKIT